MHHSQIRRALGQSSFAEAPFLRVGVEVAAASAGAPASVPAEPGGEWAIGQVVLGRAQQTADILTRAYTAEEVRALATGPAESVDLLARFAGRP